MGLVSRAEDAKQEISFSSNFHRRCYKADHLRNSDPNASMPEVSVQHEFMSFFMPEVRLGNIELGRW